MELLSRKYQEGDEVHINQLYKLITGTVRSEEEYKWEWIETWDGKGFIGLLFNDEKEATPPLLCQYSLIPYPFSYKGKFIKAGKTENCMSHPIVRGKGLFYPHEKKYFEEAKSIFKIFFTTTGKGAPGAVRRKLGYIALDYWVEFYFFEKRSNIYAYLYNELKDKIKDKSTIIVNLFKISLWFYSWLLFAQSRLKDNNLKTRDVELVLTGEDAVSYDEIEAFWEQNKSYYGITVYRNSKFMQWRINENPHFKHEFILLYDSNQLIGYVIYHMDKLKRIQVVDILAEKYDKNIMDRLVLELKKLVISKKASGVCCSTFKSCSILRESFKANGFLCRDFSDIEKMISKDTREKRPFHSFVANEIDKTGYSDYPENWYMTSLVKEGRQ